MQTWIKPNGVKVEINDQESNIKAAKVLGWKPFIDKPVNKEIEAPKVKDAINKSVKKKGHK